MSEMKSGAESIEAGAGRARPSRRRMLQAAAAIPAIAALGAPSWAAAQAARQVAGFDPRLSPDTATLGGWLRKLHEFGPIRATGTPQARAFEDWLAHQFAGLGCTIERDPYKLTSWEADIKDCSLEITEDGGRRRKLDVVAYYPFSGSTKGKPAVTGRLLFGGVGEKSGESIVAKFPADVLAESIVVVDMPLAGGGVRGIVKYYPKSFPDPLPTATTAPRPGSQGGRGPMEALEGKCRGIILCFTDISDEAGRHNYLPFSDRHRKIPALFVGREASSYLKTISGKATATMRLDATLTPNARSDTIVATLKGQSDEIIFITTHTDGPNEVNDNGALGVLALATYAAKLPAAKRRRTLVFSLPTGHYAFGAIADPATGSGSRAGTSAVMEKRPDVIKRTVAQLALEQMGAMEWTDEGGRWQPLNRPVPENWLATPEAKEPMHKLLMAAAVGEDPKYSRIGLVESGQAGGEGGALRAAGIPGLGMMGSPHYFFRADPKGVLDKLNPRVMKNQVNVATKLLVLFDRLSVDQLAGKAPISDQDIFG